MIDLERLITEKQDILRGRPEDWIDRFGNWRRRTDWTSVAILTAPHLIMLAILIVVLVLT